MTVGAASYTGNKRLSVKRTSVCTIGSAGRRVGGSASVILPYAPCCTVRYRICGIGFAGIAPPQSQTDQLTRPFLPTPTQAARSFPFKRFQKHTLPARPKNRCRGKFRPLGRKTKSQIYLSGCGCCNIAWSVRSPLLHTLASNLSASNKDTMSSTITIAKRKPCQPVALHS